MMSWSWLIVLYSLLDPVHIFADLCVNPGLSADGTWIVAPGDDALKRPIIDQWAPRITLEMGRKRTSQRGGEASGEGERVGHGVREEGGIVLKVRWRVKWGWRWD